MYVCPLCERDVAKVSNHHLVPKCRGGTVDNTVPICNDCHNAIHSFFSNKQLEKEFNSVDKLLNDEKFLKHLKWLKKQNPEKNFNTKLKKDQKNRKRNG